MPVIFALQTPNTFHGKLSYRVIYRSLRLYGRLFFTRINLDLRDVEPVDENVIGACWTVKGTLRLP
jgi:hypothetical protein